MIFIQRKETQATWKLGARNYHFTFDATGVDPETAPDAVLNEFFNGFLGGNFFFNGTCIESLTAEIQNDTNWLITLDYATLTPPEVQKATGINPLDRDPVITYHLREVEEIIETDINNVAITNSADDPFVPFPTRRKGRGIISVQKNFSSFDPSLSDQLAFKVNASSLFGYAANTMLCTNISAQQMSEVFEDNTINYWSVTTEFESDVTDQWTLNIRDKGLREVVGGKKREIKDDNGQVVSEPYFLDGHGVKLTTGSDIPDPTEFDIYDSFDFTSLGYPA